MQVAGILDSKAEKTEQEFAKEKTGMFAYLLFCEESKEIGR